MYPYFCILLTIFVCYLNFSKALFCAFIIDKIDGNFSFVNKCFVCDMSSYDDIDKMAKFLLDFPNASLER
ncbi:hypothetical protein T4D_14131 [Trichinella pseudospiralis]|uniref:Uncharacterized protein n=1 Tax=Trichinella pseudospiralis TaxID=6337 RepID=A0A0V1G5P5_TRIPS|nr:hypothetical protein T4D_14131 [Trichinella pseudospiralis]